MEVPWNICYLIHKEGENRVGEGRETATKSIAIRQQEHRALGVGHNLIHEVKIHHCCFPNIVREVKLKSYNFHPPPSLPTKH